MNDISQKIVSKVQQNWKAGLTVAMINIPLSISLAVASWANPSQGIITGIWATIFAALFASSKHNIFWVAGALTSIVLAFIISQGPQWIFLVPLLAIMSGFIILAVYFLKITKYITLIPSSVLHGFLMSVWVTIAISQLNGALGLNTPLLNLPQHKEIYLNVWETLKHLWNVNLMSILLSFGGLGFIILCKKQFPQFPIVIAVSLVGILIGFASAAWYLPQEVLLLKDKYPTLAFQAFSFPFSQIEIHSFWEFSDLFKLLFSTSIAIAIVAILETIISAKIAERITKKWFDKDKEILGLSLSNIWSGLLGGLPVSAVFVRTALNIKSGGNSKMSALLVGIFTFAIAAVFFNGFFKYLPFPIISAILLSIALGLIDMKLLKKVWKLERAAFYIILITLFVSIFKEPTYGILTGTSISLLIFLKGVYHAKPLVNIFRNGSFYEKTELKKYIQEQKAWDILVVKLPWGLNYINIENYITLLKKIEDVGPWKKIILSCSALGDIDIDGLEALEEVVEEFEGKNIALYLSGVSTDMKKTLTKLEAFHHLVTKKRVYDSTAALLKEIL